MRKITMVDLTAQYEKIKPQVDSAIQEVLNFTTFINGQAVKDFQTHLENYLDIKHVIPAANGTDALQVAMMGLGLKPGDEVIAPSFTFIATAEVIALLGLTPVLVDCTPDTFTIDPVAVRKAITPKTKAIVPVHLFGQCADMEEILKIAAEHDLFVIEDVCQAIGASYTFSDGTTKKAGTIGHVGAVSFFPSKNLGCYGDGGAIFTNNNDLAAKLRSIANHGMTVRYYHDEIGVNSRLDSIQAAILDVKLPHLDKYNQSRQEAANQYDKAFENCQKLSIPVTAKNSTHVFHQYTLVLKGVDRQGLIDYLNSKEIPAMIYYPVPVHLQKAYQDKRYQPGDFPVTEALCRSVVSLPMHTELDKEQLNHITSSVLEYLNS